MNRDWWDAEAEDQCRNIARFDVEKAFSCGMEAVHIAEQYALTYARLYR